MSFSDEDNTVVVHWERQLSAGKFPFDSKPAKVPSTKIRVAISEYHGPHKALRDCGYSAKWKGTEKEWGSGWLTLKRRGPLVLPSPYKGSICLNVSGKHEQARFVRFLRDEGFEIVNRGDAFHARGGVEFRFPQ